MFERFTEQSRRVVVLAQEEARTLGHNHIGTEHLLLGLIHEQSGVAAQVLMSAGITLEAARAQVEEVAGPVNEPRSGHIPFTQRAKKVLELSLREALEQSKSYIGTEHILLGLTRDADSVGARIIDRLGGSLSALRQQVIEAANAAPPDPVAREALGPEPGLWSAPTSRRLVRPVRTGTPEKITGTPEKITGPPERITGLRELLTPIDQRLAAIERHLGVVAEADAEAHAGLRALLASVDRHLGNIERHLGLRPESENPEAEAD